jgi:putative membrane-bound dehydrogenase-like protein
MKFSGALAILSLCIASLAAEVDLSTFQIDPRLEIQLFASEPDVADPVSLCFDEAGRMYVVEMRDYPYGMGPEKKAGGTIRLLEDTDGDGKADKSTVFAKDLSFPTSIAPWKGGVFVTAPPDIIYLKDTDGDGVADEREVYFTGFTVAATDSNMNGLRWGLDNRIHGVNGGNGGTVKGKMAVNHSLNVPLDNADFSFDPETGDLTTTYQTSGGFGLVFDEFGRSFSTYNINHIQQRIVPFRYLDRFPGMFPVEATQSISDHEDMARIFPISTAQTRPNHPEQAGHFSAAGGVGYIGYDIYPDDLYRSVTVGDVVGNLIHRDVLRERSGIFAAQRSPKEMDREFISSRDNSCRMTGLELGPDGALYVMDMQRDVIEHPDYIPEKIKKNIDIRAGENRGRIYRLFPKSGLPKSTVNLARATPDQLVTELESHNQWRRQTAQRLLVERKSRTPAARIEGLAAKSKYAPARVHCLWALDGLRVLSEYRVSQSLADPDAGVRANALQIAERFSPGTPQLLNPLNRLAADPSPQVRFQAALSLGAFIDDRSQKTLQTVLATNRDDYWTRMAALSSLRAPVEAFVPVLDRLGAEKSAANMDLVRDLADISVARSDYPASRLLEILNGLDPRPAFLVVATVDGLDRGLSRNPITQSRLRIQPILTRLADKSPEAFSAVWKLSKRLELPETPAQRDALAKAVKTAGDRDASAADRLANIRLLGFGTYPAVREALLANLDQNSDATFQREALKVLAQFREPELADRLVSQWPALAPSIRISVLNLLLSRKTFHNALVTAIEKGEIKLGELNLDLEQRRMLLRRSTPEIQARAAKFISDEEYSNRKSVADDWLKKLPPSGDTEKGRAVFEKTCSTCHRVGTLGHSVGPDLTSVSHRSLEDLLYNILDPNMAINPKYVTFQVETKDGESATGILDQETSQSISLLQASEMRVTIPRKDIVKMRSTGTSLMPEGVESGLSPADLRDLIAFLQNAK